MDKKSVDNQLEPNLWMKDLDNQLASKLHGQQICSRLAATCEFPAVQYNIKVKYFDTTVVPIFHENTSLILTLDH